MADGHHTHPKEVRVTHSDLPDKEWGETPQHPMRLRSATCVRHRDFYAIDTVLVFDVEGGGTVELRFTNEND